MIGGARGMRVVMRLEKLDADHKKLIENCYLRTCKSLWSLIFCITHNEQDSYDILQEAYKKLIIQLPHMKKLSPEYLDAYLTQIAKNLSYRLYNYKKRDVLTNEFDYIQDCEVFETIIENKELLHQHYAKLKNAIRELQPNYRKIIYMKYFLNYSNEKIAQLLHVQAGSVRMLHTRAIRILRKRMKV